MTLTFMALSRRERGAVTTATDTASARYAADAALAHAEAQIIANILSTTNPYNFGLLVSTNAWPLDLTNRDILTNLYFLPRAPVLISSNDPVLGRYYLDLNRNGRFDTNGYLPVISPYAASPYYNLNGDPVANYDATNALNSFVVGDPEWIGVLQRPDVPYGPNNPFVARYAFIAVPVGNTLDLNAIHNQALNPVLSYTRSPMDSSFDGYFRNQGVGSWEINLAAFLTDLNTNQWQPSPPVSGNSYQYLQTKGNANKGLAFYDAFAILTNRYAGNYDTLDSVDSLFGGVLGSGHFTFREDNLDGYSDGQLQTGFHLPGDSFVLALNDNPANPWVGADNTNHFFSHQELFDPGKSTTSFTNRLQSAGTNFSTYDRYTFYRLLSQLGTDTTPDLVRMNLNYDNLDPFVTNGVSHPPGATNFMAWQPLAFFTNAADRLLRAYTAQWRAANPTNFATTFYAMYDFTAVTNAGQWTNYPAFGIENIPVLVSNRFVYSPAVNRLLQLAANLFEATRINYYPSVFRPTFWATNEYGFTNVYINGYQQVLLTATPPDADPQLYVPVAVTDLPQGASVLNYPAPAWGPDGGVNVYGVPWIIGARKGFPNFNEFEMQDIVQITRKLQVTRTVTNKPPQFPEYETNQMYIFGITNNLGIECWNSYTNAYSNTVQIVVKDHLSMALTNAAPGTLVAGGLTMSTNYYFFVSTNINFWPGCVWGYNYLDQRYSTPFVIALETNVTFLPTSVYRFGTESFVPATSSTPWETNMTPSLVQLPHFGLATTNYLQFFMLDGTNVIDYVHLNGPLSRRDISAELSNPDEYNPYGLWQTNLQGLKGVYNQLDLSRGLFVPNAVPSEDGGKWEKPAGVGGVNTPPQDEAYFGALFMTNNRAYAPSMGSYSSAVEVNLSFGTQAPYTPTRTMYEFITWQANDPLVHHLASDLQYSGTSYAAGGDSLETGVTNSDHAPVLYLPNLRSVNDRYAPWSTPGPSHAGVDTYPYNLAYKDPLVFRSDHWDFPANKFPTAGWMGRVHRGTPWQTVYLKSSNILAYAVGGVSPVNGLATWVNWTGDQNPYDAANAAPTRDRLLFDVFTTAFNDNATRGTLPVNIGAANGPNLAAWSALFSGLVVRTNLNLANGFTIIEPAGAYYNPALLPSQLPALLQLVQGINSTRATQTNADGLVGAFEHVGDILRTPELTQRSPFLAGLNPTNGISDELYEWLPLQVMSLLRCSDSPRYVIYSYGQALKPAPNAFSGNLVTNYQVVAEIATRAVVRFNGTVTNPVAFWTTNIAGFTYTNWFTVPVVTNNNAVIENFNPLPPD